MTKLNSRAIKALKILEDGGVWFITSGRDHFGKPVFRYILVDADEKKVKGFGMSTFRAHKEAGLLNVDAHELDMYGIFKIISRKGYQNV